jgi:DNA-binding beta-propeller fold protein YncE
VDAAGNIVVTDLNNNRVQIFDADTRFLRAFGLPGTAPGQFDTPCGVAFGADGRVTVTDTSNDRIQQFELGGLFD